MAADRHDGKDDGADEHPEHRPKPARDADAAQQSDDQRVELVSHRPARYPGLELGSQEDSRDAGQQRAEDVERGEMPPHLDAGQPGCFLVRADQIRAPAGHRLLLEDEGDDDQETTMISTENLMESPGWPRFPSRQTRPGRLVFRCAPLRDDLGRRRARASSCPA